MAEEFMNGFVHQNGTAVITHNPLKAIPAPRPRFRLHARKLLRTSFYHNTFTSGDGEKKTKIWIILAVVVGLICLGIHIFLVWRFKRKPKGLFTPPALALVFYQVA
ncbi:hypothetical protein JHK87_055905 [Glycine soja]|nr:hypothetical protein JHK87_055905 [Glycine soja]